VSDYLNIDDIETEDIGYMERTDDSRRQILGQYDNGDYAIITAEGRGYQSSSSTWFTLKQIQTLCKELGLKFAFALDGGGSAETVSRNKQYNPFYDNIYGRVNPTFIVFNGTTSFETSI
jgi:exopolysaccharide biosynthesis protein